MILYFSVALGVLISIVLPLLRVMLPQPKATTLSRGESTSARIWRMTKPYVVTGLFSLLAAFLIVALLGESIDTWQKALLAGYTADATLQKITTAPRE